MRPKTIRWRLPYQLSYDLASEGARWGTLTDLYPRATCCVHTPPVQKSHRLDRLLTYLTKNTPGVFFYHREAHSTYPSRCFYLDPLAPNTVTRVCENAAYAAESYCGTKISASAAHNHKDTERDDAMSDIRPFDQASLQGQISWHDVRGGRGFCASTTLKTRAILAAGFAVCRAFMESFHKRPGYP